MAEGQTVHVVHHANYPSVCALELWQLSGIIKCAFSELCVRSWCMGLLLVGGFKHPKLFRREEGSDFDKLTEIA